MSDYFSARCFAMAWFDLNKIAMKEAATSMRIARTLKCWDGNGGAAAAKRAVIAWRNAALKRNHANNAPPASVSDFYSSQKWRTLRYEILKRSNGCCSLCGTTSQHDILHVDHIKPRSKYPHLALDITNLQVLCSSCNKGKSNKDETDWRKRSS